MLICLLADHFGSFAVLDHDVEAVGGFSHAYTLESVLSSFAVVLDSDVVDGAEITEGVLSIFVSAEYHESVCRVCSEVYLEVHHTAPVLGEREVGWVVTFEER